MSGKWRHGYIPLDAQAALEKAHGSHKEAARLVQHDVPKARAPHDAPKAGSIAEALHSHRTQTRARSYLTEARSAKTPAAFHAVRDRVKVDRSMPKWAKDSVLNQLAEWAAQKVWDETYGKIPGANTIKDALSKQSAKHKR